MYDVTVKLIGQDGNAFNLIGIVAKAISREIGHEAARKFQYDAMECGSYDELLSFIQQTVNVE